MVIAAGDAGAIDMLNTILPRYFPALMEGGIASLKCAAAGLESTFDDIQQTYETLKPFTEGNAHVLLLGGMRMP